MLALLSQIISVFLFYVNETGMLVSYVL